MYIRSYIPLFLFTIVAVLATVLTAFGIADYTTPIAEAQEYSQAVQPSDDLAAEFAQVNCQSVNSNMNISSGNMTLRTRESVGGAIDDLVFKGIDIVNSFDHGRQLQYAMSANGHGECYNPTEGGSQVNGAATSPSTSRLVASCKLASNQLYTKTRMAFWLPAGASTSGNFCNGTTSKTTVNTTNLSEYRISKIVTAGYNGNENIIRMVSRVNIPEKINYAPIEIPTIYLNNDYKQAYRYEVATDQIIKVSQSESEPKQSYITFLKYYDRNNIGILSNGTTYVALYSPRGTTNGIFKFDLSHPDPTADGTKLQTIYTIGNRRPGSVEYFESFVVVGNYDRVLKSLKSLIEKEPMIYDPSGSVDIFQCDSIQGWACDTQNPSDTMKIEVYTVDSETNKSTLVKEVMADSPSEEGVRNLCNGGENKRFGINMENLLQGLNKAYVEVFAVKTDGSKFLISNGLKRMTCL